MTKNVSHPRLLVGKRLIVELNQIDFRLKEEIHNQAKQSPTNYY